MISTYIVKAYIDSKKNEEELKEEIAKLEAQHIAPLKEALLKVIEKKDKIKEELIKTMETENIVTYKTEDVNISKSERKTLQVVDMNKAIDGIFEDDSIFRKVQKIAGQSKTELKETLIIRKLSKEAMVLIDNLNKVENVLPKGFEYQVTPYLTVKEK
jgi:hypothetical protein